MTGNGAKTTWRRSFKVGLLASVLGLLLSPAGASAQSIDPRTVTTDAIERLRFAQESFPAAEDALEEIIRRLERSRVATDGEPLVADVCHLRPAPQGLTAWIEARQAVLATGRLLDRADSPDLPLPPALVKILRELRTDLVEVYRFLAGVALQEARALGDQPSSGAQLARAEEAFSQADQQLLAGEHGQAMQSLRQAWEHALLAVPEPAAGDRRPILSIEQPLDGTVFSDTPIDVAGMVQLLVTGTVGADDVTVSVNARPAEVVHRSFLARGVPLDEGLNALVAVAKSAAGAVGTSCIAVVLDTTPRARIEAVSGTVQSGEIRTPLPEPLGVRVSDAAVDPVSGAQVIFRVVQGDGSLDGGRRSAVVATDGAGLAAIGFTLGSRAGVAVNRVRATAVGIEGEAIFAPTAVPAPPESINPVSGDNQRGAVGEPLALPLVVVVTDAGQNPVEGTAVTFEVVEGGGSIQGAPQAVVPTDADGRAAARLTLGAEAGLDNQQVLATFPGFANEPVVFKASAFETGDPADTRVSGVVQDNQGDPVPGVTLSIEGTEIATTADAEGQFTLAGVPVGEVILHADASTAARPGTWASLSFDLHTLPGVDNRLEKPIYILPLDLPNGKIAGGPEDVTIEVPEVPGFSLTVLAGSATFPDGSETGLVSVTPVHADKVPMAPGSGMQPRFIVTVQPAGVHFDPPAPVTFPNVDGLPPGAVAEMFSFDHDLAEFVSIGTGTVSEDGTVVRSDPGFGIVKAGWHCAAPQSGSGAGATVSVAISTSAPLVLGDEDSGTISASGSPARDVVWSWQSGSSSVASLSPSGGGLCPDSGSCPTTATAAAPGKTTATVTLTCTTTGASDSAEIEVIVPEVEIEAEAVNQDDPTNDDFDVMDPEVVYGGSEDSTADDLKLRAVVEPSDLEVARYIWSVSGPGSSSYTPPPPGPDAEEWEVGDIAPEAGELEFRVEVEFVAGGSADAEETIEVGIRTDDVILIGWIEGPGVTLPAGAASWLTTMMPPTGPPVPSPLECNLFMLDLSENFTTPNFQTLTSIDRDYILHWLFKFADNPDPATLIPGGDFRDGTDSHISYDEVDQFVANKTIYKLVNHFQIKYRTDGTGFKEPPTALRAETGTGTTKNPCGSILGFLAEFAGQKGDVDGPPPPQTGNQRIALINDGSPDAGAIRAFNTLTGKNLPAGQTSVFWENIGSKITFSATGGTAPQAVLQNYPTYFEYHNGRFIRRVDQAATPRAHFFPDPYPFGTVICIGLGGITPGGRCGDAESPPASSARIPPYVQP